MSQADPATAPPHDTREAWLERAVEALRPTLTFKSTPRVACGFPSRSALARKSQRIGEHWPAEATADKGRGAILISPLLADPVEVLAVLLHELIHEKVGPKAGHRAPFKREMRHVGLEGKATATVPGPQLAAVLARRAAELGPYPHAAIVPTLKGKVQGTRLLKARCPACDCVVRVTRQWAGENGETAPICGYCGDLARPETLTRMVLAETRETEES